MLPFCLDKGIGVIVHSPTVSGLLSGATAQEGIFMEAEDDWPEDHPAFREPGLSASLALVDRLRAIGGRHDSSPDSVAVAWTLHHLGVTTAIVGPCQPEQVNDMVAAAEIRLTQAVLKAVETVAELAA
jgi:aryl-alcohol dehydrogenase-like predicted oxidoreductase